MDWKTAKPLTKPAAGTDDRADGKKAARAFLQATTANQDKFAALEAAVTKLAVLEQDDVQHVEFYKGLREEYQAYLDKFSIQPSQRQVNTRDS
jgi:hypothetical protein